MTKGQGRYNSCIHSREAAKKVNFLVIRLPSSLVATFFWWTYFFKLQKKFFFLVAMPLPPPSLSVASLKKADKEEQKKRILDIFLSDFQYMIQIVQQFTGRSRSLIF